MAARFYVYALRDADGSVLYVGKGSGRRFEVQKRAHSAYGEILKRFASERDAYAYERRMIAELQPLKNVCAGGNGCRVQRRRRTKEEIEIERVGSRKYVARFLLSRVVFADPALRARVEAAAA